MSELGGVGVNIVRRVCVEAEAPEAAFAAAEVSRYLGRAGLETGSQAKTAGVAHVIFSCAADTAGFGPDDFVIMVAGRAVRVEAAGQRGFLYGAYALLEDCGFRSWAPDFKVYRTLGVASEQVPELAEFPLSDIRSRRESPRVPWRGKALEEFRTHDADSALALIDWMGRQRLNLLQTQMGYWDRIRDVVIPAARERGIEVSVGGHGYESFITPAMQEEHPSWCGLLNGTAYKMPRVVFCTSQKDAVECLLTGVIGYLRDHPEASVFAFWPPDTPDWCDCAECQALGSIAERHARLVNALLARLRRRKMSVRVRCLAYMRFTEPPTHVRLKPEVDVELCPVARDYRTPLSDPADRPTSFRAWGVPAGEKSLRNYRTYYPPLVKWFRAHPRVSMYEYYFKYGFRGLPMVMPRLMGIEISDLAAHGVNAHITYSEPGTWAGWEVGHYALARLLWGGHVDALLADYLARRFGSARDQVGTYLVLLEGGMRRLYSGHGDRNFASIGDVPEPEVRDAIDVLEQARRHLCAALKSSGDPLLRCWDVALTYALAEARLRLALFVGTGVEEAYAAWTRALEAEGMRPGAGVVLDARTQERLVPLHDAEVQRVLDRQTALPGATRRPNGGH